MREELLELIPEFDLIEDPELRENTLRAWELGMTEGGWTLDDLQEMPFTLLINPCPVDFVEHTRVVVLIAIEAARIFAEHYGDRAPVNMDFVVSGGILRDVGKLLEYERDKNGAFIQTREGKLLRHPFTGMELAARCGLPADVQHIIASHAGEGEKVTRTTESTLVHHADFISFHSIKNLAQTKTLVSRIDR
ncbi:MAG: HDIG domain-containing protein [Anaerolineae bacterium]|nr:HDIG domain-containing protein [Anaerolineae bacterium]